MGIKIGPRAVLDSFLIAFRKFDCEAEARELSQNPEIAHYSREQIQTALEQIRDKHKNLLRASKTADISDKFTSALALGAESLAVFLAFYLELPIDIGEEFLEMIIKMPAFLGIIRHRKGATVNLLKWEALSLIPVAGQLFDIFKNNYVNHTHQLIRDGAVRLLLDGTGSALNKDPEQ